MAASVEAAVVNVAGRPEASVRRKDFTRNVRIVIISYKSKNSFGQLVSLAVGLPIVFQAMINMGVAVQLFPVTGQPLPLISTGGTSIWITFFALGILLSVSRNNELQFGESTLNKLNNEL